MIGDYTLDTKQSNGKVALKAGIWYVISNVMVKAISVITTPLFTRMMSTAEYGTVQTFISWHTLLLPIFSLNLTFTIGRAKLEFPGKLDEYIGAMQVLSGIFSLVISGIIIGLLHPVSSLLELSPLETIILLLYLTFGTAITFHQSGYRYKYKYKQNIAIAWYSALGTTVVSVLMILVFKGNKADLRMAGIVIPTMLLSLYFWGKSIRTKILRINFEYWKYGLKISVPLIFHTISMHILSQSDRIFITKIWGQSDTAFYSLAYTYGVLLHVFTTAAAEGWLPWFHDNYYSGNHEAIKKNVKPLIVLGCYIGLACAALAPEATLILGGSKYAHSVPCVPPIVFGVVCQYIYTQYVNIELHLKKTAYVSAGTILAALFNIVTNAIFIPIYGFVAAAYTTLASYFLLMIIHFVITKKVLKVNLYDDLFMFGALIITGIVTAILMLTYDHAVIRYALIAVGFASFLFYFRDYINGWIKKRKAKR